MFIDTRLPINVERGARGGPRFRTEVLEFDTGQEHRNIRWHRARGRWDIAYGIRSMEELRQVVAMFRVCRGRAHTIRFRDWVDYQLARQQIGTGDGASTSFQLFKRYEAAGETYDRDISLPVAGTVQLWVAGAPLVEGADFAVDYSTGLVILTEPPAQDAAVEAACDFDVKVRFDIDELAVDVTSASLGEIPRIPVVEVKGE